MWPLSLGSLPLAVVAGTTVAPPSESLSVRLGPVTWLGVGFTICSLASVVGRPPPPALDPDDPHPARSSAVRVMAASSRWVVRIGPASVPAGRRLRQSRAHPVDNEVDRLAPVSAEVV